MYYRIHPQLPTWAFRVLWHMKEGMATRLDARAVDCVACSGAYATCQFPLCLRSQPNPPPPDSAGIGRCLMRSVAGWACGSTGGGAFDMCAERRPPNVGLISLAAHVAAIHPDQGPRQVEKYQGYGMPERQIDTVIGIACHRRDPAAHTRGAGFDNAYRETMVATASARPAGRDRGSIAALRRHRVSGTAVSVFSQSNPQCKPVRVKPRLDVLDANALEARYHAKMAAGVELCWLS
ncbi:MAG: hypothetical protein ACFCUG_14890 [Thiotrichales bacterium]